MKAKIFLTSFFFNGEYYYLQTYKLFTLTDLILFFDYKEKQIVLEHNEKISNNKHWSLSKVKNCDHLEILTIVGGG